MKSKNPKIQTILKKGIVVLMTAMLTLTPIVQATSSLDDNYLDSSWLDKLLYGSVGSTAKEIEEYLVGHNTLYITNQIQLRALAEFVNNGNNCSEKRIVLLNDIEIDSSREWVPIGRTEITPFRGTFDGNGFSISGLKYLKEGKTQEELIHVGLFGISYGNIKNLTINSFNIDLLWDEKDLKFDEDYNKGMVTTIQVYTGNIAGKNYGTIENCINNSNIRGGRIVGGLVGSNDGSVINCKNTGDIDGFYEVGGIVGEIPRLQGGATHSIGKVENCTNEGKIHAAYLEAGGIVGSISSNGQINNCINAGNVFASKDDPAEHIVKVLGTDTKMLHARVGGIVGYSEDSNVNNCINEGEIYGYNYVGGIVGYTPIHSNVNRVNTIESVINKGKISGDNNIGGIVGRANNTNISNVANQQIVNGNDVTGGIAGKIDNTKIINSANTLNSHQDHNLNITGNNYVGGIVGSIVNSVGNSELKYNINKSAIRGNYAIGGIAGYVKGTNTTIENCYNEDSITYDENDFTTHDIIAVKTAGGIVGDASNTTIKNSINVAEVCIIESAAGGIAGALKNSTVNNCAVQQGIKVDTTNWKHYFTEGYEYSTYNNKANPVIETIRYDRIYTPGYIGSIVGNIAQGNDEKTEIKKCFVGTSVVGGAYVGGVVGKVGAGGTVVVDEISRGEIFKGVRAYAYDIDGTVYGNYIEFGKQAPENLKEQAGINNIGAMYGYNVNKNSSTKLDTDFTGEPVLYEDYTFAGVKLLASDVEGDTYYQIDRTPDFMMGSSYLRLNVSGNDVLMGCDMGSESIGQISSDSTITAKDSKGTEVTFTISGGTVKNNVRYFKAGDKITVKANFNKYLATTCKPLTKLTLETAPTLKLNNSIEMTTKKIEAVNLKTVITYEYTVSEGQELEIKTVNLSELTPIYAGEINDSGNELLNSVDLQAPISANVSNLKIDAVAPKVNTNIYVENELETERYTTGKDIIIEVTTDERIDGDYNRPEIKVEFSESGDGKYNYSKEENTVGFAKCVDAKLNIDGTTTWKYIYQIQEGDEGEFEFNFASGTIKDVAGNTSNIATLYTPQNSSFGTQASNWNSNVGISYKLYKNSVSNTNEVNAETYFANGDDLVVVTTFDKVLYSYYTKINDTEHKKAIDKNAAPSLYLPNGTKVNASSVSNSQNTVITYKFEDISNNYQTLTNLKALKLVNENNKVAISLSGSNVTTTTTTEAQPIIFKLDNSNANIAKNAIKIINIENVIIDNQGVSEQLESNIYADTTAPMITITTDTTNPTNANLITYTIEASEKVVGCEETDIIVNNGTIKEVIVVEEGRKYTVKVETVPVSIGNQEEVKLILEEGVCKDLVGRDNVRAEHVTIIDKKAPEVTITSDKEYVKANEDITYTLTWSEEVVEFTEENITVNNGTKGTFAGEGNKYTLVVRPTGENDVEVVVDKDATTDVAGNSNIASAKNIIPVIPTVEITTNTSNPTKESEITYTFVWNEKVVGFDISDILLPNGITGTLIEGQNNTYTMLVNYNSIIPEGNEGEVTVAVKEKAVKDLNGNENAYTANIIKIDRIAPIFIGLESYAESTISLDSNVDTVKQYYKAGDIVTIIATFTENIEGSNVPTLNLQFSESGNAKAEISSGVKSGNKITYTYTITNGDVGTLSVKGFAGEVKDAAGNTTKVTKRILDGDTIIADTRVPNLNELKVVSPNSGVYKAGEQIKIEAIYDEEIYSLENNVIKLITSDNAPVLKLKFGDNGLERTATAVGYGMTDGKVDKTKVEYTYTIVGGTNGDNGLLDLISYTNKTGLKVCDIAGNEVTLGVNQTGNQITADTIRPEVINITAEVENPVIGNTGIYHKAGNEIKITLEFNEEVSAAVLTPKILIGFSEDPNTAPDLESYNEYSYESNWNVNSTKIEYTYEIKDGDNGYLWVIVPQNQFADEAGNGNIEEAATKVENVFADTTSPQNTSNVNDETGAKFEVSTEENDNGVVTKIKAIAVFSEEIFSMKDEDELDNQLNTEDIPQVGLFVGGEQEYTFGIEENTLIKVSLNEEGKTVIECETTKIPDTKEDISVSFTEGRVYDRAGNEWTINIPKGKDTALPIFKDIKIMTPNGFYKAGDTIEIVARFDEQSILLKVPRLNAILGNKELTLIGEYDSEHSENTDTIKVAKYTYPIEDGDNGALNIISLIGEVTDRERTEKNINQIYIGSTDEINASPETLLNSQENQYENNQEEYKNVIADTTKPVVESVEVKDNTAKYVRDPEEFVTGSTNSDAVEYIITFSEPIKIIDETKMKLLNAEKVEIIPNDSDKDGYYEKFSIITKPSVEGVQSLLLDAGLVKDRAGNNNEDFRFNGLTTDFTEPTVRFISEYNGGIYVLPTGVGKIDIRPNVEISEDISKIEYKWDDGQYKEINEYSTASDIVVPTKEFTQEGNHKLYIRVTDCAGNVSIAEKEYQILESEIKLELNKEIDTNEDVLVTITFGKGLTDNRKVLFRAEGSTLVENLVINAEGKYVVKENGIIYVEATDRVGNKVYNGREINNIDRELPLITLELYEANLVIAPGKDNATIKTEVNATDNMTKSVDVKYLFSTEKEVDEATITNNLDNSEAKITNATRGTYYLHVLATDNAGNKTLYTSDAFTVFDANKRTHTDTVTGETTTDDPTIKMDNLIKFEREGKFVNISYNNFTESEGYKDIIREKSISLTNLEDGYIDYENYSYVEVNGATTITVIGKDACGNEVVATFEVTRDMLEGPEINIYGNPKDWTNQNVKLEVDCYEELSELTVEGTTIEKTNILEDKEIEISQNGTYKFVAKDIYGNISEKEVKVEKIDKSVPEISETKAEGKIITITATDALSGIAGYAITNTTEVPVEWSESKVIKVTEDGIFYVWVKDNAGNIKVDEEVVTVDTTAPTIAFNYTSISVEAGLPIQLSINTDEEAIISYSWDEETWVDSEELLTSVKVSKEYKTTGAYTLYAKAKDKFGNETKVQTIEFSVVKPEEIEIAEIIFNDLPTIQVDGVHYVKVAADMTIEDITNKMDKDALCGVTPEYKNLTEDNKLKTGSEITLDGDTKYIVVVNGDVNCDGKVAPIDVTLANRIRLNKVSSTIIQRLAADFDLDGIVKAIDITMINRYRLGKIKGI